MELQNVKIFILCARHLSFSRVAELTYSSQSTVSKAIAALEDEFGEKLFLRSTRRIELTAFGEALLPYAKSIESRERELYDFVRSFRSGELQKPLELGIATYLTASPVDHLLLPVTQAVTRLRELHEGLEVRVNYVEDADIPHMLDSGQLSLAVTAANNNHIRSAVPAGMDFLRLDESQNYLLYNPIEGVENTLEAVLPELRCLVTVGDRMAVSVSYDFMRMTRSTLRLENCDNWSEVILRVKSGIGGTILGASTAEIGIQCGLNAIPLTNLGITTSLLAVWKRGEDPAAADAAMLLRSCKDGFAAGKAEMLNDKSQEGCQ